MSFIVPEEIEAYAAAHTTPPDELLAELAEETKATLSSPQMLTGPIEGRFLELLVHGLQAKRVLEFGTYSGYSSLSMAAGLPQGGRIDTCEVDETHAEVARRYIGRSPFADRITVHLGPALETIERLDGEFDFIFIDADKENYVNYYEAVLPRLSAHGLIAADNTLWSGRVLDEGDDSEGTRAIKAFNKRVRSDQRVTSVMLTIRDGVTLIRPKNSG
jgi:predicted O-methyltransferase YrrM